MGLAFPAPNPSARRQSARLVWTGRDQAFLMGADPAPLAAHAALTDQSDGWAGLALEGAAAVDVLARLYPLDLRAMPVGSAARAPLNHMSSVLHAHLRRNASRSSCSARWPAPPGTSWRPRCRRSRRGRGWGRGRLRFFLTDLSRDKSVRACLPVAGALPRQPRQSRTDWQRQASGEPLACGLATAGNRIAETLLGERFRSIL